jgi:hypothetical protein
MMRRPQFSLRTLLWLMAVVAAFCGGLGIGRQSANQREQILRMEAEQSREIAIENEARARAAELAAQVAAKVHQNDR